jgi:hypothetical protein
MERRGKRPKWQFAKDAVRSPMWRYTDLGMFLRINRAQRRCSLFALAQSMQMRRAWLNSIEHGKYTHAALHSTHRTFHQQLAALWEIDKATIPPFAPYLVGNPLEPPFEIAPLIDVLLTDLDSQIGG